MKRRNDFWWDGSFGASGSPFRPVSRTVSSVWVASLDHKALDYPVKHEIIIETRSRELNKVTHGLRNLSLEKLNLNCTERSFEFCLHVTEESSIITINVVYSTGTNPLFICIPASSFRCRSLDSQANET